MSRYNRHQSIVNCLLKRQQGDLLVQNVLNNFVERQAAIKNNKYIKCELAGTPRSTFLVTFSPDGTRLASTHGDHTIRIIELKSGRCLETLIGHPRTPWSIAFHPSKHNILASGCLGGEVRVWDLTLGGSTVYRQTTAISSLAFHPTDMVLLIATDNQLLFWNWEQPTPFACLDTPCKRQKLRLVKFDPLGHHILTGIRNLPDIFQSPGTRSDRAAELAELLTGNSFFGVPDPHVYVSSNQNVSNTDNQTSNQNVSSNAYTIINQPTHRSLDAIDPQMSVTNNQSGTGDTDNQISYQNVMSNGDTVIRRRLVADLVHPPLVQSTSTSPAMHHYRSSTAIIEASSRLLSGVSSSQVTEMLNLTSALQARIDQAIVDSLAEQGHVAMASNMTGTTCRLQLWDFTKLELPKLQEPECNIIVAWCKLYNDASTDISSDGRLLGAFVPNVNNTTEFGNICVFSLESYNLGQCLFSKKIGPNAISVSFSPLGHYVLIGIASRRMFTRVNSPYLPVVQIYELNKKTETIEHVSSLKYPPYRQPIYNVSTNAAFWNPIVGSGLVYGTNKGEIFLCHTSKSCQSESG